MLKAVEDRRRERERLIGVAREYVNRLSQRLDVKAAAVAGSVARGDFNVWSDVDVVVIAEDLPPRIPDRGAVLIADAPAGVQPVGFTPEELLQAVEKRNALAVEAIESGIPLAGEQFLARLRESP